MTPQDEIPGISTYLYGKNRYREDHEYINYWKIENKQEKLLDQLQKLGYTEDNAGELIDELERDYSTEIHILENSKNYIEAQYQESKNELYKAKKEIGNLEREKEALIENKNHHETIAKKAHQKLSQEKDKLVKYGTHDRNCKYVDLLNSGRRLTIPEKDLCDCGWTLYKLELLDIKLKD